MAGWRKYFVIDEEYCDHPSYLVLRIKGDGEYDLVGAFERRYEAEMHAEELAEELEEKAERDLLGTK